MKIGIAYDTAEMYNLAKNTNKYHDFADELTITSIKEAFIQLNYQVELLGNTHNILNKIKNNSVDCDIVYNTVEGIQSRNREGLLPSLLEICDIPYTGTDSFGLSLTLDKTLTKLVARNLNILTPDFILIQTGSTQEFIYKKLAKLKFPIIIKPNFEGNSTGISVCSTVKEANEAINLVLETYNSSVLCEEFIEGKEITVPLIGNNDENKLFGITTVDVQKDDKFWLDSDWKQYGDYKNVLLNLSPKIEVYYKKICLRLFKSIGCKDFARFDFRMTRDNKIYFIEVNPLPSLFKNGSFDIVGQSYGFTFEDTLEKIIDEACTRQSIPKI